MNSVIDWAAVLLPTIFAIALEIVSPRIKGSLGWRAGVIIFGVLLSVLVYYQQYSSRKEHEVDQAENRKAIAELSQQVKDSPERLLTTKLG